MKTVHSNEEFECNTCNKSYSNKEALKRHLQFVHSNEKFKCSKCNKSYSNKDNLNRHMKFVHVNDKKTNKTNQFKCLICGTTFLHKHSLQVNLCQKIFFLHQLTHNIMTDCSSELQVQYMKIPSSEDGESMLCTQIGFLFSF